LEISLLLVPGYAIATEGDQPPVIHTEAPCVWNPKIPAKMRYSGNALLRFVVDENGIPRGIQLLESTSPLMERTVVGAFLKLKISPGLKEGKPVAMPMVQRFSINLDRSVPTGFLPVRFSAAPQPWDIPWKGDPKLPLQFQYDLQPYPYLTCPAVYPRDMLTRHIEGSATIAFAIDPMGRPRQFVVAEASRPEFGPPTIAMMATWRFTPPRRQHSPCWAAVRMTQVFDLADQDIGSDDNTKRIVKALTKDPCPILANLAQLDSAPVARYNPAPLVTSAMIAGGQTARAVIEIVIDRDGGAQVPAIISASSEEFGWAAATAAARWQFTPPTSKGEPVDVFARIPFEIKAPATGTPR
jgi:TonB family protein